MAVHKRDGDYYYSKDIRESTGYYESAYIEGNTVRKANAVPERREWVEEQPEPRRYPQRKPVHIPGISGRSFVFLVSMLSAVIFSGFSYLSAQYDIRGMKSKVVSMQSEIAELREDNDEAYQAIVENVDLSEIYRRATKKLKMVQAENNQIYKYSSKKSDMVKQYADIPGAED